MSLSAEAFASGIMVNAAAFSARGEHHLIAHLSQHKPEEAIHELIEFGRTQLRDLTRVPEMLAALEQTISGGVDVVENTRPIAPQSPAAAQSVQI